MPSCELSDFKIVNADEIKSIFARRYLNVSIKYDYGNVGRLEYSKHFLVRLQGVVTEIDWVEYDT